MPHELGVHGSVESVRKARRSVYRGGNKSDRVASLPRLRVELAAVAYGRAVEGSEQSESEEEEKRNRGEGRLSGRIPRGGKRVETYVIAGLGERHSAALVHVNPAHLALLVGRGAPLGAQQLLLGTAARR